MRNILNILLVTVFVISANYTFAQNDTYIKYNQAYMDKYQYKVENLSAYGTHVAYHIYTSNTERIILNISMSSYQNLNNSVGKQVVELTEIDWNAALINEINNELETIHLVFNEDDGYQSYKVSSAIFVEETNDKLMYSGPYYSCTFYKNRSYGVAQDLDPGLYDIYDESIFMTNNGNSTNNCLNEYGLIKILKETHPKGSFTMIANEDFTSLKKDEIYETCQSALYVTFVENIGIIEERTKNGAITLIGINNKPINTYIAERCQMPAEYNVQTASNTSSVEPVINNQTGKPGLNFITRESENTEKSGNTPPKVTNSTDKTTTASGESEYELIFGMIEGENAAVYVEKSPKVTNTTTTNSSTVKQHIVDNNETLYSISKQYGTTVKALQEINNLETADIFVTQVLIIR